MCNPCRGFSRCAGAREALLGLAREGKKLYKWNAAINILRLRWDEFSLHNTLCAILKLKQHGWFRITWFLPCKTLFFSLIFIQTRFFLLAVPHDHRFGVLCCCWCHEFEKFTNFSSSRCRVGVGVVFMTRSSDTMQLQIINWSHSTSKFMINFYFFKHFSHTMRRDLRSPPFFKSARSRLECLIHSESHTLLANFHHLSTALERETCTQIKIHCKKNMLLALLLLSHFDIYNFPFSFRSWSSFCNGKGREKRVNKLRKSTNEWSFRCNNSSHRRARLNCELLCRIHDQHNNKQHEPKIWNGNNTNLNALLASI